MILPVVGVVSFPYEHHEHKLHHPKDAKGELRLYYGIGKKDLKDECDKNDDRDDDIFWKKIEKTLLDVKKDLELKVSDRKKWDEQHKDDEYKAQKKVIKTALPCANDDKVYEKLTHYKEYYRKHRTKRR
ncbi:uncharacterized protein LOC117169541 isoform X2 [Belonocnema kinseyi]|uniref:uncharacterized protein LOC117169541 isoform X2 n=1 Tax=Belonocnema kinseyi TaxID=2817044 RepID=UPI00143D0FC1|nr:uncharacterized protein LOC117169541 isoform X2 [Belonocnema kinseyi]